MELDSGSFYGNLLYGLQPSGPEKPQADDIFAGPAPQPAAAEEELPAGPEGPPTVAGPPVGPQPAPQGGKEPSSTPLPQAFSAAKLMMPPVRKRAEPVSGKRVMPALDISKLQEEKEALLRQRASAEKKDESRPASYPTAASTAGLGASGGAGLGLGASGSSGSSAAVAAAAGSAVSISSASLYGSPDEEYDPAKPNDYDEFCRRRMRQKAEEEMARRREEALARQQAQAAAAKPPEPKEDDFATRMMKKMGWKEGQGCGKEGQGMTAPLIMKKVDRAAAVITEGQKREAAQQPQGQPSAKQAKDDPKKEALRPPSKVILLNNLVGAGEVDEDLEEETAEEAGKYGKLKKCVVREMQGLPDDQAVRIFLEYEKVEDATKALVDMNGRYFGGRIVRARFFDEGRYESADLDKRDDE